LEDILISKFGLRRDFSLPTEEELLDDAERFLRGDDEIRERYSSKAERAEKRYLQNDLDGFSPESHDRVKANLFAARGNLSAAATQFSSFANDADLEGYDSHASFYDLQSLIYSEGVNSDTQAVLGRQFDSIVNDALDRNPGSSTIVSALNQFQSDEQSSTKELELTQLDLKEEARFSFSRLLEDERERLPDPDDRDDPEEWKEYWRARLQEPDHGDLLDAYCDVFELLGSNTPQKEISDNDAKIEWEHRHKNNYRLAVEVKGWESDSRDSPPELKVDHVEQARDNARHIDADSVLLVSSRRGRQRLVQQKAEELGVHVIREHQGRALANRLSEQCAALHKYSKSRIGRESIPLDAVSFEALLQSQSGGEIDAEDITDQL
jgi:hypothetical protein